MSILKTKPKKVIQHFFRNDRVTAKKEEGWKVVDIKPDKHNRVLGIKLQGDITLMEKEI